MLAYLSLTGDYDTLSLSSDFADNADSTQQGLLIGSEIMPKISFELDVYTYQIDFLGHVNNAVYIHWMEIGRIKLLEAVGMPTHEIFKQGFAPVLVQTSITYKSPLYLGDRVQIDLWLSDLRNASAIMQFRFYNNQQALAAEAIQKGLFVDRQTMRPKRLRPEERALFMPYLDASPVSSAESETAEQVSLYAPLS
jgi:acyl-CoA thioester hydrolase